MRVRNSGRALVTVCSLAVGATALAAGGAARPLLQKAAPAKTASAGTSAAHGKAAETPVLGDAWETGRHLAAGETVEIAARLLEPSVLPANGRVGVEWTLQRPDRPADVVPTPAHGPRAVDALGIYTAPTAGWRKVLHALDPDVFLYYRAPVAGTYRLRLAPVTSEAPEGETSPRWREKGTAPQLFPLPAKTPWTPRQPVHFRATVTPVDLGTEEQVQKTGTMIEAEPNDTPEQAQYLALVPNAEVRTYEITGSADDVEFFDNGRSGRSGDDWFRVELKGNEPRLVTAQLAVPGQNVAGRVRCYRLENGASPKVPLGGLLPIAEYFGEVNPNRLPYQEGKPIRVPEGQDPNERTHQQEEPHRIEISRIFHPGTSYYFRVEANAPGYQLQVRVLRPAPYTDPRMAIRQGMYEQIGQVEAWLCNRPRGASVERRIRDSGNLLGTGCMSCHTQSGVWGPAVPVANGYPVENVQNFRHLLDLMYECLRPTNELKDAAVNTSLAPLDLGDGPAGTRAAGFNIVNAEPIVPPTRLHSAQQIRTANYVLQTNDPGGINAAGPGSNAGQNIVWLFAGEILDTAWKKTGDPRYFRALEYRARRILALEPRYTDDLAVRLDFFGRVFRLSDYPAQAARAAKAEAAAAANPTAPTAGNDPAAFVAQANARLSDDVRRLRAIQNADGTWGFHPGISPDGGKTWNAGSADWDPAPTALAVTGLTSMGFGSNDPSISKGVQALLRLQDPCGRWNKSSITGMVTSAYCLRALGRLYPVPPRREPVPPAGPSLPETVRRIRTLALSGDPGHVPALVTASHQREAAVRYWAMVGLGMIHTEAGVTPLLAGVGDGSKAVRQAAVWGLRQTLLDDHGWAAVFTACEKGDDATRESAVQALGMRADAVLPHARFSWSRLTGVLDHAMNDDPHPAVRAWAAKSAWQWWIWNPPVREAINRAWVRMLERPEANLLVENSNRYSSQALFIANGHKANGSATHQYRELASLFEALRARMEKAEPAVKSLLARRLVAIAGTFYQTAGSDGGPGQLGYSTPGSGALFGQSVLVYLREAPPGGNEAALRAGLEAAANVPHGPLQEFLLDYALKGPESLRLTAASAVADPRSTMLQASIELVDPLVAQIRRGAMEPGRRASLSEPVLKLFGTVNWIIPRDAEQQRRFFSLILPRLDRYQSRTEMAAIPDPARRADAEREMDASWYLADRMGEVLASNPDLHQELVARSLFPTSFRNPLERHFWIRSVPWILELKGAAAAPAPGTPMNAGADELTLAKDRALQLYLDALGPKALPETRAEAVKLANATAVRRNPEVIAALARFAAAEPDGALKKIAENVVSQGTARFVPDLVEALRAEKRTDASVTPEGKVNPVLLEDVTYFRDYIIPELARAKRADQKACMGCHGVPGRVPSFYLKPVDDFGYLSAADLLFDYRAMQARVDLKDLERSKVLRKPLNVQDGKEDGHQGGRRYLPQDEGYLMLRKWVANQPRVLQAVTVARREPEAGEALAASSGREVLKPRETQ